jgi:hypothetical protein
MEDDGMDEKQLADRLRKLSKARQNDLELNKIADELDPPRPKLGTVVWFQQREGGPWELGMVTFDSFEDEPVVISATDGYTFAQLSTWKPVSIPDEEGYCVVDGELHKLVEVPLSADTVYFVDEGDGLEWTAFADRFQVMRKEKEYGL